MIDRSCCRFLAVPTGTTPSAVRPGNPTPGHAQGQGSPSSVRPTNPTPAHATKVVPERPGAPSPKGSKEIESPLTHPSLEKAILEEGLMNMMVFKRQLIHKFNSNDFVLATDECNLNFTNNSVRGSSIRLNVLGEPRPEPVRVPAYLASGKPNPSPNKKVADLNTM